MRTVEIQNIVRNKHVKIRIKVRMCHIPIVETKIKMTTKKKNLGNKCT